MHTKIDRDDDLRKQLIAASGNLILAADKAFAAAAAGSSATEDYDAAKAELVEIAAQLKGHIEMEETACS